MAQIKGKNTKPEKYIERMISLIQDLKGISLDLYLDNYAIENLADALHRYNGKGSFNSQFILIGFEP